MEPLLAESGEIVARNLVRAHRWTQRLRGLLGRASLEAGSALWILPCQSIHTCFMRFPIDVAFLDREGKILRLFTHVAPWRIRLGGAGASSAVELPAGTIETVGLREGDRLQLPPRRFHSPHPGRV